MYALNFYSPMVADQLRSRRKTATIRLGDKSGKYKKGMVVQVLCGVRYSPREKVFDAVIDKVEVKRLGDLSPREIEHDNPEIRRPEELAALPRPALQPRRDRGRHGDGDPLLRDPGGQGALAAGLADADAEQVRRRAASGAALLALDREGRRKARAAAGAAPAQLAAALGALAPAAPPPTPRSSAARSRRRRRRPPSRRASGGAPPGSSCASRAIPA